MFGLHTISPILIYAFNNCFTSNKNLTLTAAEVHCLRKFVKNDKLTLLGTCADVLGKQVEVPNCKKVSPTSDSHNFEKKT